MADHAFVLIASETTAASAFPVPDEIYAMLIHAQLSSV
jgi:hypothetical protein